MTKLRVSLSVLVIALGSTAGLREIRSEAQTPSVNRSSAPAIPATLPGIEIALRRVQNELQLNRSAQQQPSTPANRMAQLKQREQVLVQQEANLAAQRDTLKNQPRSQ